MEQETLEKKVEDTNQEALEAQLVEGMDQETLEKVEDTDQEALGALLESMDQETLEAE
jgi:hypothetical protein